MKQFKHFSNSVFKNNDILQLVKNINNNNKISVIKNYNIYHTAISCMNINLSAHIELALGVGQVKQQFYIYSKFPIFRRLVGPETTKVIQLYLLVWRNFQNFRFLIDDQKVCRPKLQ